MEEFIEITDEGDHVRVRGQFVVTQTHDMCLKYPYLTCSHEKGEKLI